jgi:hypothetical protein
LNTSADNGMSTIKQRYIKVYPKVMLKPGKTRAGALRLAGAAGAERESMNYLTVYNLSN